MANSDKMTRDIMSRVKKSVGVVPRYASGTARLFLASGAEFFKNEMPAPIAMVQTNQELLSDAVRFLRNPVDAINKQVDRALGSEDFKALQKFAKNALDDLKTGNLYDPVRDRSELGMQIDADLANFGGVDLGNFDENGDWIDDMGSNDDDGIAIEIAKIQDQNDSKRTSATIDAIGASTNAIVNTENANTQMSLRMSIKQHSQQMQALENMITAQTSTFELINKSVQASMNVTREAHNQMIGKLDEMTGLLQKIAEGVSPKPEKKEYKEQEDIFGFNGELNIKQYLKRVVQNVDDKYAVKSMMSNLTMGMGVKGLLELVQDNPWTLISSQIIQRIIPEKVQKQMQRTNKNLESFMPALLQKLGERGRAFDEGRSDKFSDLIAGLFGVTPRSRTSIETAYENPVKQAQFTAKTARAIEEVIPMWLARIDSHISGGPLMVYNYKTGKLENAGRVVSTYEHSTRDLVGRMGDSASEILDRAAMYRFDNSDEQKKFLNFVYRYLQKQGEENRFINPYQSAADFKNTMPDTDNRDLYYNLLSGILTTMPRDKVMQASRDILSARQSRDKNTYTTNNDLKESGLIAAWSGFMDQALQSKLTSETNKTRSGLTDIEIDNISKELHDKVVQQGGTQATNVLLADIVRTLRGGIITYSYNLGKKSQGTTNGLPSYVKERIAAANEASIEQYNNNQKVREQRKRYETTHASIIAAQNTRATDERAQGMSDEAKMFVNLTNTSAFDAAAFQAAINYSADSRDDPDNPVVVRRRQALMNEVDKLNGTRDKVMQKTGISGAMKFLRTAAEEPFRLFGEGLRLTDAFMFKMLFGEDAASNLEINGEPYLLQTLTHSLNAHFKNAADWFASNVGNPMKKYLLDEKTGLLPRIGATLKDTFGWDDKKAQVKGAAGRLKDRIIGTREIGPDGKPIGEYKGGRFSSTLNKFNSFGDTIGERITVGLDHMLYGEYGNEKRKGVKRIQNRDEKGRFASGSYNEYGGVIGKLRQGFDNVQDFLFGDDDSREKWNKVKGELNAALPDMIVDGGIGMVASLFLPGGPILGGIIGSGIGLVKGSNSLSKFLFGEFSETQEEDALDFSGKKIIDRKTGKTKKRKVQTAQGLISREVYDGFKQYAPKMTIGAMIGAAAGGLGLLPFGMGSMAGTVIGSIGGMLGASEAVKTMIFGDGVNPDSGLISKNFKNKVKDQVKKYAPASITGALAGAGAWGAVESLGLIPGLSLIPGGPIFGMLGGLVGMSNADKFNQFLFGDEVEVEEDVTDANGKVIGKKKKKKREGGAFGGIFNFAKDKIVSPIATRVDQIGKNIGSWFHKDILGPLGRSMDLLKESLMESGRKIRDSMLSIGDKITTGILSAFNIEIGGSLKDFFKEKVIPKFKTVTDRFFGAIGKIIGGIIAAPFKALEFIVTGAIREPSDPRAESRREEFKEKSRGRAARTGRHVVKNAKHTGSHLSNFVKRVTGFFGFGSSDFTDTVGEQSGTSEPTVADNQYVDSNGRVRGRANTANAPSVIQLGPSGPSISTTSNSTESDKEKKTSSVTDSERNKDDDQESDSERNRKRNKFGKRRSDNSYLGEIAANTRSIKSEIKGQLGGTGWNIAYIKTLLETQFGPLSDDQLPEEMEGSKKVRKRRGIFGKAIDSIGDWIDDKKTKAFDFFGKVGRGAKGLGKGVGGFFRLIFHPIQFLGKMIEMLANGIGTVTKGLFKAAEFIGKGIAGAVKTAGKFIMGAAEGLGKSLGSAVDLVTGAIADVGLAITATARGIVEFVADTLPDVGHLVVKSIGAVGKGLFKGAKAVGTGIGKAGKWVFNKIIGKKDTSVTENIKNIGSFRIDGGYLDKVSETLIKVGDPLSPVDFPILSMLRGKPLSQITHAVPVYVVGTSDGGNNRTRDRRYKRAYQKADKAAERSGNPAEVYDRAVAEAETAEEIQAIALASQMNANEPLLLPGNVETKDEKTSFFSTISKLLGGENGLGTTLATLLGGTALGGTAAAMFSKFKTYAGTAGSTLLSGLPGMIGAANAASNGEYGHAAAYGGRGIIKSLGAVLKAGASSSAPELLQKANLAVASAVTSAPNKLATFIKTAISKFLTNKNVASFLTKLKVDPSQIVKAVSGNLDNICANLAKESAEQLLKKANLVILIGTAVYDFTSGMYNANQYFTVNSSDTSMGMRVAAGLAKAISGIAFGLIPVGWLASTFYKICASAEAKEELAENQEAYKAKVAAYNAANGTNLTPAEFAKKFNDDGTEKKGILKRVGEGIASGASYLWNGAKNIGGKAVDMFKQGVSSVGNFFGNIGNKIATTYNNIHGDNLDEKIMSIAGAAAGNVVDFFNAIPEKVKSGFEAAKTFVTDKFNTAVSSVKTFINESVPNWFNGVKQTVTTFFGNAVDGIGQFFGSIGSGIKQSFINAVDFVTGIPGKIKEKVSNTISSAKEKVSGAVSTAKDIASNVVTGAKEKISSAWDNIKTGVSNTYNRRVNHLKGMGDAYMYEYTNRTAFGTGRMTKFSQTAGRWNRGSNDIAAAGCGPTAAAMVATSYGRNANPAEANQASYMAGMRAADGGTNPEFFKRYAASKGYGMEQGPTSSGMIQSNLAKGRPVVLMGRGGDFGSNTHYLVADRSLGKGRVNIVDPLTGGSKVTSLGSLVQNTSNTIYSYGKGPGDYSASNTTSAQNALVNAMAKIQGKLDYSLDGNKQNPDNGSASCASTVGWAYRKTLGGDFTSNPMSASSTTQAQDNRFKTIWVNSGNNQLDTKILQPGDVMYFNWGQTKYNGQMKHTEMYAGNNQDWSHGGNPKYGPTLKDLNDYRRKHLMMVRRYAPFVDGKTVTYSEADIAGMNLGGINTSETGTLQGDTIFDKAIGFLGGIGDKYSNFISGLFGANNGNEDGTTDTESANAEGIKSSTNAATIAGTTTGAKIYNYLIGKGFTKNQAAGIMGNLYAESGLSSNNLQNSYEKSLGLSDVAYTNAVNSGSYKNFSADQAGYGLAQWTSSGRKAGLLASAKNSSKNIDDLGLQLDYLWSELNGSYKNSVLNPIKNTNTVRDATKIFMQKFEVPKDYDKTWMVDKRTDYSNQMLATYGTGPRAKDLSPLPQLTSWGTGGNVSANLSSMNDRIRRINRMITKTREEANKTETAAQITTAITDAVDKATNSDQSVTQVLQVLSASLSTMIQLLSDIKENTAPKDDETDNEPTRPGSKLPTVRADHFDPDTGVGTNSNNIGASIIDALTSK